jgi:ABC-2 type transport system ATP-binding protein
VIQAEQLVKRFGELTAVDSVSFEISKGETFGLLGPNGAGKTTTIHMLVGALKPDGAKVVIDSIPDPTHARARQRIGIAPQALALYENLSAAENVAFFGKLYGLSGSALQKQVYWALSFTGLSDRRKDRTKTYSGGMKRRLNLACAVVHKPHVLFLDEPTVGVDPQSRNHIFENIETLKGEGTTILYTTHYMEEAQRLCDRVAIMDKGKVLAMDTVDGLIETHGGKSLVTATMDKPPEDPSALPGELDGRSLRVETDRPLEEVARLTDAGVHFTQLRVDRPDLEAVFLNLTGRRLRD